MLLAFLLESPDPTERELAELFLLLAVGLCVLSAVAFGTTEEQNYTAKKATVRFTARFWGWLVATVAIAVVGLQMISWTYPFPSYAPMFSFSV